MRIAARASPREYRRRHEHVVGPAAAVFGHARRLLLHRERRSLVGKRPRPRVAGRREIREHHRARDCRQLNPIAEERFVTGSPRRCLAIDFRAPGSVAGDRPQTQRARPGNRRNVADRRGAWIFGREHLCDRQRIAADARSDHFVDVRAAGLRPTQDALERFVSLERPDHPRVCVGAETDRARVLVHEFDGHVGRLERAPANERLLVAVSKRNRRQRAHAPLVAELARRLRLEPADRFQHCRRRRVAARARIHHDATLRRFGVERRAVFEREDRPIVARHADGADDGRLAG